MPGCPYVRIGESDFTKLLSLHLRVYVVEPPSHHTYSSALSCGMDAVYWLRVLTRQVPIVRLQYLVTKGAILRKGYVLKSYVAGLEIGR